MTDLQVCALAMAVSLGAFVPIAGSVSAIVVSLVGVGLAWARRRPWLLVVSACMLASLLAGMAWDDLSPGQRRTYHGTARLVSDPEAAEGGVRLRGEIDGRVYDLRAWGSPAGWLRPRLMGETVTLTAQLRPLGPDAPRWLRAQGIGGRGVVTSVSGHDVGQFHTRLANSIRRTIESGASSLERDDAALFTGLVYGDDREQSPLVADNFKAAGLTHLLAVSGQNVAFTLAIVGPLLRRLDHRARFLAVLGVLVLFATVTRFEPSVIRASSMAAIASVGALVGNEVSSRRVIGLAVTALVLVDPLIVHQIAFQLSVAASLGILAWSGRLARAIVGPRWLAEAIAVTSTAQIAVAPLLLWRFGGVPVAALPANVLAGPVAGPVMMWGLTGGLVAGLVPSSAATLLHLPTELGVWWIDGVAAVSARIRLGELGPAHVAMVAIGGAMFLRGHNSAGRTLPVAMVLIVLAHPALALLAAHPTHTPIGRSGSLWADGHHVVLVLDRSARPAEVLEAVRRTDIDRIDLLIVERSTWPMRSLVGWLGTRYDIGAVWAPTASLGLGEVSPPEAVSIVVGDIAIIVEPSSTALEVHVRRTGDVAIVD